MNPSPSQLVVVAAALACSAGCVSYPIVKPEAFQPKPRLAVVAFQTEAISDVMLGMPLKLSGIDQSYAQFQKALATRYELVPIDRIRSCQDYFKLPRPLIDTGTSANGLERVTLTKQNVAGLAKCVGADLVVTVHGLPQIVPGFQIAGIGTSRVRMETEVHAWDNAGQEIWLDHLQTESDGFRVAGAVLDPADVDKAGTEAMTDAAIEAVSRVSDRLASSPAAAQPKAPQPAPQTANPGPR